MTGNADSPRKPMLAAALAASLIALAALAVYANSFSGPFVFDDVPSIRDNPAIRQLWPFGFGAAAQGLTTSGRPLVALSLAINYAISGEAVWSYHALNLTIHILAALTLFGVVRRTLRWSALSPTRLPAGGAAQRVGDNALHPILLAFAIALLWAVHPLQTECVTYIVQRAESMMGLFYLLTLYCFIRYVGEDGETEARRPPPRGGGRLASVSPRLVSPRPASVSPRPASVSTRWAALSVLACLCGMASKEVAVTAPLVVLLYDRTFLSGTFAAAWRRHGRLLAALASTWILLFFLAAASGGRDRTAGFHAGVVWWRYALAQFPALLRYLRLSLWPHPLVFDYGRDLARLSAGAVPSALVVIALVGISACALLRPAPPAAQAAGLAPVRRLGLPSHAFGFAGISFFLLLAPTSSIVPVATEVIAEHRMYLPLAAVLTVAVLALRRLPPVLFLTLTLALAAGTGFATARRNLDYRSDLALWSKTAEQRPDSADAQYNYGFALAQAGQTAEAAAHDAEAVRLDPSFAQAQNNLALALEGLGRSAEAIDHWQIATHLRPDLVEAQNDLGNLLLRAGRLDEAVGHYETALQWQPNYPLTHLNLGLAMTRAERLDEAEREFQQALRLQPDFPEAYFDLGNVYAEAGLNDEAVHCYEAALRLRPGFADARSNLAVAQARRQVQETKH